MLYANCVLLKNCNECSQYCRSQKEAIIDVKKSDSFMYLVLSLKVSRSLVFNNPRQDGAHKLISFIVFFTRFEGFCIEWKQK